MMKIIKYVILIFSVFIISVYSYSTGDTNKYNEKAVTNMFDYTSPEFDNVKDMESEKKELINALCDHVGLERKSFRLQLNTITLQGKNANGQWYNLTSRIGDFREWLKNDSYTSYRLRSRLEFKK